MSRVGIINCQLGNIGSIVKRVKGHTITIIDEPQKLKQVDKLILPGVGHFGKGIEFLKNNNLLEALNEEVLINKKPILGICLGMQLLMNSSEEGDAQGLGWIDGSVKRFHIQNSQQYKIPHTGWNTVNSQNNSPLFRGVENERFYFVHSYYVDCTLPEHIIGTSTYEDTFTCAVQKGNIFGTQFHPEKSHNQGLTLINNFLQL
jgi:glutamine amidotransferase